MADKKSIIIKKLSSFGVGVKTFLFTNQAIRQTIVKNAFWLGVSNVGGRLLRAVIIIYAARVLGAADWGVFSYAISLAALLTIFTDLGIGPVLTRETARARDESSRARILSTAFLIKLILVGLGILVVFFLAPHFTTIVEAKPLLPIIAFVLVFDALREFGFSFTRALEKMEWEAGLYLATNVAIVVLGFIFLAIAPTVASFTYAYALGTGIGMAATFFTLRHHFRHILYNFYFKLIKPIFAAAMPFAIAGVLGGLMLTTDILIIGFFRSAEEVGFYSAADRIIQLLYLLPGILATSSFPLIARLTGKDNLRLRRILERLITIALAAALPMALGGVILGKAIVELLFGTAYLAATLPFQILIFTIIIRFPAVLLSNALFAFDKQKALVIYAALGGVLNVTLDLLFIPTFGMVGSAWTTLVAQLVSNIYLWQRMKRINYFAVLPSLGKVAVATILMAVFTWLLSRAGVNLILVIGLSAFFYLALLSVLKEPLLREFKLILRSAV